MELTCYINYFYNEKEHCFYLGDRKTKYKDLFIKHKNDTNTRKVDDTYYITINNYIYQFDSPRDVLFKFPEDIDDKTEEKGKKDKNNEKEGREQIAIFISSYIHIDEILFRYKDYDFYYRKDSQEKFQKFERSDLKEIYPLKEIEISFKKFEDIYQINNKLINDYSKLNPNYLSLSYKKYLKNSEDIEDNSNFFNLTKERIDFFNLLTKELKKKKLFLPICGPEGIGKTSSILAFCRINIKFHYFYYNIRAFSELMKENNNDEIIKMLREELSRVLNDADLNYTIKKIMRLKSFNSNPMEFLINILDNIKQPQLLIIDQYKTAFDDEYYFLKQLLNKFNSYYNIILLSSMNEDDVKGSIVKVIKNEKISVKNFFLDYLYIGQLAKVSESDLELLDETEKQVLSSFGNLYSIFYEILEFKKKNSGFFDKKKFITKIGDELEKNLSNYYKTEDKTDIDNLLTEIIDIELSDLNKEEFLKIYMNIPFRYIKVSIDKKNIFKISEISNAKEFKFEYLYNYFIQIILRFKGEIYEQIQKDQKLLENLKKSINPISFENNVFYCIWGNRKFNRDIFKKKIKVTSIYEPSEKDCQIIKDKKNDIEVGEGFIISHTNPIAPLFDVGILILIKPNIWRLYLIQITLKKDKREWLTTTSLDDYFGFITALLKEKCDIIVEQKYFCYIFDNDERDEKTINHCNKSKIDYIFFKKKDFELNYENMILKEYKMKKVIIESKRNDLPRLKELFTEKYYPEDKNFTDTKSFLSRKRKLLNPKEFDSVKGLKDRITIKKNYYDCIEKNFNKKKDIDLNDKDETINNYLADTEFLNKTLIGIQIVIPNQNNCIDNLKNQGLKNVQIKNFFDLIEKDKKNLSILNIEEIEYFIPSLFIPEFMTYIILKTNEDWFYQDYEKKKSINLSSKEDITFINSYIDTWKYFAISFINKNLAKEKNS